MHLVPDTLLSQVAIALLSVVLSVLIYYKYAFRYWKKKGVPYLEPTIPCGNLNSPYMWGLSVGIQTFKMYKEFKKLRCTFGGVYQLYRPALLILDPQLIKDIWTKDFQYFTDRGIYVDAKHDPFHASMFTEEGNKWRNLRVKFTPAFTSGKLKMMFETMIACAKNMETTLNVYAERSEPLDIKNIAAGYTVDNIGSCIFGVECNSFTDPNAEFLHYARKIFTYDALIGFKRFVTNFAPALAKLLRLKTVQKDLENFFRKAVEDVIKHRNDTGSRRQDFMQLLVDMKNDVNIDDVNKKKTYSLSMNELVAQAVLFFVAGYETSSSTIQFCLYELARYPEIQKKARDEIRAVYEKHGGAFTYEALAEMSYVEQILEETLRLHPSVPNLNRMCTKDYKIPGTEVTLEKDTLIWVSAYGLHHDPDYFPNPEVFDPERFSEANRDKIVPFTYLPFGEGPRNCVGMRLGKMQTKIGVCYLLKDFEYSVSPRTTELEYDYDAFVLILHNKIYLDVKKFVN